MYIYIYIINNDYYCYIYIYIYNDTTTTTNDDDDNNDNDNMKHTIPRRRGGISVDPVATEPGTVKAQAPFYYYSYD